MRGKVRTILGVALDVQLVDALLDAYYELKEYYYAGRHRPSELESGRFCEAAIRCIQQLGGMTFTPLRRKLRPFAEVVVAMENARAGQAHESIRVHIPRLLLAIYGVRNRRNVGHVGGDVNPNGADAILLMTVCDWVLAELVRLVGGCPVDEAQQIVDNLVTRRAPIVQEFGDYLKVLDPSLHVADRILILLYHRGASGASLAELRSWLKTVPKGTLASCLWRLEHTKLYVHRDNGQSFITEAGMRRAESILRARAAQVAA